MRHAFDADLCSHGAATSPAGRRWARDDLLCASAADSFVIHGGVEMPVCGIHRKTHARWGADAVWKAAYLWAWESENTPVDTATLADLLRNHP
ncbi:MAG TPA: hypothetical protein VGO31_11865 [Microbacteriaceae bacterium]|jgi:hypothetical protein|nr:hypothetical protein [Microbacteriaceae bacterium]